MRFELPHIVHSHLSLPGQSHSFSQSHFFPGGGRLYFSLEVESAGRGAGEVCSNSRRILTGAVREAK